jgi:asparagine synthase (glutamine-hydrolysing)
MANFLLIVDPDPNGRQAAVSAAQTRVAFLPRLRAEVVLATHYGIAWAAAPGAPVSRAIASNPAEPDCILFGEPHDNSGRFVPAADLQRRHSDNWTARNELNGFYAALLVHPQHGVRAEADALGMFPLYHWRRDQVMLVATSPELFRCHPLFDRALDFHGVAGLLLTSGLVGGRTLWRGVRRLPADHLLLSDSREGTREMAPSPPAEEPVLDQLDEVVGQAAALHVDFLRAGLQASRSPALQLSGGLDSRLLAGFTTQLNHRPHCLTFGRPEDLDAHCARLVAEELDLPQTLYDVTSADYAGYAASSVDWEQLSGGLYALPMGWNMAQQSTDSAPDRVVCGLTLDAVIGGPKNVANTNGPLSFEQLRIGRLGFKPDQLKALLGAPELVAACDAVKSELLEQHRRSGPTDALREWRMNLAHRHRFAVGACAWRYALFAWPVMPALDRRLIRLAARLPFAVVKNRQVQTRMLITRFPQLARLDLDRNYLDTLPLLGAKRSLLYDVRRRAVKLNRRVQAWLGQDPRFYVRTMEFNSPGWRVVRRLADDARSGASALFRPRALAELLPPARVTVRHIEDPIIHSTPLKNTLGLILWMRQHA